MRPRTSAIDRLKPGEAVQFTYETPGQSATRTERSESLRSSSIQSGRGATKRRRGGVRKGALNAGQGDGGRESTRRWRPNSNCSTEQR